MPKPLTVGDRVALSQAYLKSGIAGTGNTYAAAQRRGVIVQIQEIGVTLAIVHWDGEVAPNLDPAFDDGYNVPKINVAWLCRPRSVAFADSPVLVAPVL